MLRHPSSHRRALAALALLAGLLAVAHPPRAGAIVGGQAAPIERWPWMAGLLQTNEHDAAWAQFCGGVVIAPRRVLTAAHCVEGETTASIDVLIGRTRLSEPTGRRMAVRAIRVYPGFVDGRERGLDAAVVTLAKDAGVPALTLAGADDQPAWPPGTLAWTMGWGRLNAVKSPGGNFYYADRLRDLQMPVASDDACESAYGVGTRSSPYRPQWTVCAGTGEGRVGSCFGDSGAPLVVAGAAGWLDIGILTGGDACAARGYYDLYARVDHVRTFALAATTAMQPDPVSAPTVRGAMRAGRTVRCSHGRWRGRPAHFAIHWTRGDGRVVGTGATLRLSAASARRGIACSVTAGNRYGTSTSTAAPRRSGAR